MKIDDVVLGELYYRARYGPEYQWRAEEIVYERDNWSQRTYRKVRVTAIDRRSGAELPDVARSDNTVRATDLMPWADWWSVNGEHVEAKERSSALEHRLIDNLRTRHGIVAERPSYRWSYITARVCLVLDEDQAETLLALIQAAPRG